MTEDAGDVDDGGAFGHQGLAGLAHPERAVEVDLDDLPEALRRLLGGRDHGAEPGVVDQHVHAAEAGRGDLGDALAVLG